jgi:hypothetical protein
MSSHVTSMVSHGRWFSPCIPASSTTKTGRHDIAEILLKVALTTINQLNQIKPYYKIQLYIVYRSPQCSELNSLNYCFSSFPEVVRFLSYEI